MRITGGRARGIRLGLPKGGSMRPAMDRLRQAVFSSLATAVEGSVFVDLFAGSGSYGLEALSRGAAGGVFVERDRKALGCLEANLAAVCKSAGREPGAFAIVPGDAFSWQTDRAGMFTLVFADPPFRLVGPEWDRLFSGFDRLLSHDPAARIVLEKPAELEPAQPGWTLVKRLGGGGAGSAEACIFAREAGGSEKGPLCLSSSGRNLAAESRGQHQTGVQDTDGHR